MTSRPDDRKSEEEEFESDLIDITKMPPQLVFTSRDSVLANSVRRVLTELGDGHDVVAVFGDAV